LDKDRARRLDCRLTFACRAVGLARRLAGGAPCELVTAGRELPCVQGQPTAIVKLSGLGSLAMLAPVLAAYAEAMTPAEQYLVTDEANRPFLELLAWPIRPLYVETSRLSRGIASGLAVVRHLRNSRVAAVADLEYYSRACTLLSVATGSPLRVAFADGEWRRNLLTHAFPWGPRCHFVRVTQLLLGQLAGQDIEDAIALPLRSGVIGDPRVAPRPGRRVVSVSVSTLAMGEAGSLPPPHVAKLLSRLAEEMPVDLVFIGSRSEVSRIEAVIDRVEGAASCTNLAGKTDLPPLLSMLRHSDLLIANDSGALHLAVGLGTPTLSFYGPSDPAITGPRAGPHTVAHADAICSPCINPSNMKTPQCREQAECLSALDPSHLAELAVEALLSPPSSPRAVRVSPGNTAGSQSSEGES
jgi:ADP-heptose:LPS heptosyltransferase